MDYEQIISERADELTERLTSYLLNNLKNPGAVANVIQIMILAARAKELTTDQKVVSSLIIRKRVCKTSRCCHLLKYGI